MIREPFRRVYIRIFPNEFTDIIIYTEAADEREQIVVDKN